MAEQAVNADYRDACLDLEQRWLKLALSYEYSDRINDSSARLVCNIDELRSSRTAQTGGRPHG
jgi:hypothetical protein